METKVTKIILEALKNIYGDDLVKEVDGNIYVMDNESTGACEISIRYEE